MASVQFDLFGGVQEAEPFLHWMGGKRRLWSQMRPHFPERFNTYHEPFLGGGAVFLNLQPQAAFISDALQPVVDMWSATKRTPDALLAEMRTMQDDRDFYYAAREEFNSGAVSPLRRAALLIFFTHTCFGGQARFNGAGGFNTAYAARDHRPNRWQVPVEAVWRAHAALERAQIACEDFTAVLDRAQPGDLVYMDPPYDDSPDSKYTGAGWTGADTKRLADTCRELVDRGAHVLVSNNDTPLVRKLFEGFRFVSVTRPGTFNHRGDKRTKVAEVLVIGEGVETPL